MAESDAIGPPKPARAQWKHLNGDVDSHGLDSNCNNKMPAKLEALEKGKPRFLSSFLVDARGGVLRCTRHSGLHLVIPPGRVCMPTRITCKLVKVEKLSTLPVLKEGESLVSRVLELGPVATHFVGPVLIELPHVASLHKNQREVVALRSNDGVVWSEQPTVPLDLVEEINQSAAAPPSVCEDSIGGKSSLSIVLQDFPSYLVAVSRVRQQSRLIGVDGGSLTSDVVCDVSAAFPKSSVTKETHVGLQVCLCAGGANQSKWEDITTAAPMNIVNSVVLFSTTVSARFWLVDCGESIDPETLVSAATRVYKEVVAVPIMARFVVYARRHRETEAQLRVICVTGDTDVLTTLESHQGFVEVGRSDYLELTEGKFYCLAVEGNLVPSAASTTQLAIQVHPFRANRLSFIVQLRDQVKLADCKILVQPAAQEGLGFVLQQGATVGVILVFLEQTRAVQLDALHHKPGELESSIDAARQQAESATDQGEEVSGSLKLGDIASALHGDWVLLAEQLGLSEAEIVKIQTDFGSVTEQAMIMLHLWVAKGGHVITDSLERAMRQIGRDDIIDQYIHGIVRGPRDELAQEDIVPAIDTPCSVKDTFRCGTQASGEADENPMMDVQPSEVYQIEEVWNGTEWRKTAKAVPKLSENTQGDAILEQRVQVSIVESQSPVEEKDASDVKGDDDEDRLKIDMSTQAHDVKVVLNISSAVELPQIKEQGSKKEDSSRERPAASLESAEVDLARKSNHPEEVISVTVLPAEASAPDDLAKISAHHVGVVSVILKPTEPSAQEDSAKLSVQSEEAVPATLEPTVVSTTDLSDNLLVQPVDVIQVTLEPTESSTANVSASVQHVEVVSGTLEPEPDRLADTVVAIPATLEQTVQHEEMVSVTLEPAETSAAVDSGKISAHTEVSVPATLEQTVVSTVDNSANLSVQPEEVISLTMVSAEASTTECSANASVQHEEVVSVTLVPAKTSAAVDSGKISAHTEVAVPATLEQTVVSTVDNSANLSVQPEEVISLSVVSAEASAAPDDSAKISVQPEEAMSVTLKSTEPSVQRDSTVLSVHTEAAQPTTFEPRVVSSTYHLSVQPDEVVLLSDEAKASDDVAILSVHADSGVLHHPVENQKPLDRLEVGDSTDYPVPIQVSTADDSAGGLLLPESSALAGTVNLSSDVPSHVEPTNDVSGAAELVECSPDSTTGVRASLECPGHVETPAAVPQVVEPSGVKETERVADSNISEYIASDNNSGAGEVKNSPQI